MKSKISRRDFLRIVKTIGTTGAAMLAASYYSFDFEPSWLDVSQVEIPLSDLPKAFDGYRILQISDIHMGGWMNREHLAEVITQVKAQNPDLVVITGDFVIGRSWTSALEAISKDFIEVMLPLASEYKTIAVMGNHDHWTDVNKVNKMLADCGIICLQNDIHHLSKDGDSLYIAGLDDVSEGKHKLEHIEYKLPENVKTILLVHEPDYANIISRSGRFMMQLSGHSHGGQVVIPFLGPPILPRWGRTYPSGLYQVGDMWLYTNRGVGMTSPFIRFNCRPEVTVFTLHVA